MTNNIKEIRQKKNISAYQLSKELGISKSAVSQWENNKTVPSLENLIKISQILNVSIDELIKHS